MPLDRYALLSNVLVIAGQCLDLSAPTCEYEVFVGLGDPPQDCSVLSARYLGGRLTGADFGKCILPVEEEFEIILTRCCLTNTGEEFDPVKEDNDARCFLDDFGTLFECLACYITSEVIADNSCRDPFIRVFDLDDTVRGNCYTGRIRFGFTKSISCCEIPTPS